MIKKQAFTLIELIIVVVIISILALIAIPRYFANIGKATKSQIYNNLDAIRQAEMAYYAVYGAYKGSFPIVVAIEGETIVNLSDPSTTSVWPYWVNAVNPTMCPDSSGWATYTYKNGNTSSCYYALCLNGRAYQSCTP